MQQIREKVPIEYGKFSKKDLEELSLKLDIAIEQDIKRKNKWLKEREINRKVLHNKAKELGKEIPFEVAWHCFLAPFQTYVGSGFLESYKEWL